MEKIANSVLYGIFGYLPQGFSTLRRIHPLPVCMLINLAIPLDLFSSRYTSVRSLNSAEYAKYMWKNQAYTHKKYDIQRAWDWKIDKYLVVFQLSISTRLLYSYKSKQNSVFPCNMRNERKCRPFFVLSLSHQLGIESPIIWPMKWITRDYFFFFLIFR